jgi:PhnB protein
VLDFYRRALGAGVTTLMRFKDSPDPAMTSPGSENKVMHSSFRVGDAIMLASDGRCQGRGSRAFPWLSQCRTKQQRNSGFAAPSDGGQAQMPPAETFFSPRFGVVADRFGVRWMVLVEPRQ